MADRDQMSLVEALVAPRLGRNDRLERIAAVVAWEGFEGLLRGLDPEGAGRPPYDPLMMLKALLRRRRADPRRRGRGVRR